MRNVCTRKVGVMKSALFFPPVHKSLSFVRKDVLLVGVQTVSRFTNNSLMFNIKVQKTLSLYTDWLVTYSLHGDLLLEELIVFCQ
jgi:hypothetical protein